MQQQLQKQGSGWFQEFKTSMGWAAFLCRSLATTVEVFLHQSGTFGERYLGIRAAAAVTVLFFFPALFPGHDPAPVQALLLAFCIACLVVKGGIAARRRAGVPLEHSYYSGRPWLMRLLRRSSEVQIKSAVEPCLVWVAALTAYGANKPLGAFLFLAGAAQLISVRLSAAYERTRALDMNDALMEQRRITEEWRRMRRD